MTTSFYKIEQHVDGSGSSDFEKVVEWVLLQRRVVMTLSLDQLAHVNSTIFQIEYVEGINDFKLVDHARLESVFSCLSSQLLKSTCDT